MKEDSNYKKIKDMCLKNNIAEGKTTDEYIFTLNAVDYFYYNRNIGELDIIEGYTDGANDGGIDYIFNKDEKMFLIQGKSSSNISVQEIKNVFSKIIDTIDHFEKKDFESYNKELVSTFLNRYDDLNDDKNMELVLFTNTMLSDEMKEELEKFKNTDPFSNYTISIYGKEEIEEREIFSQQGDEYIKEDSIELFETNNKLTYLGGIIVNIKASSLKKLFKKHSQKGLFSYNLREHISQKNVDNGIENTIKNDKDNFWFYNNGITIGCTEYSIDGNKIKLYNFSIINGAQTTTKIGNSKQIDESNDFALVCKIVQTEGPLRDSLEFISKISETSNSQKPIRPRDLKANSYEQKRLQTLAAKNKYPLAIEIKRGVKPSNEKSIINKWQKVTNEYIGQLILACNYQKPGTARSGKSQIFTSDKVYYSIYKNPHDYDTLYDFVRIASLYDEFKLKYNQENTDMQKVGIARNGKFTVLAVLFYLYKRFYCNVSGYNDSKVHEANIKGQLTLNYKKDDYEEKLYYLFGFIINQLSNLYTVKEKELNLTSFSNFFKTDSTYTDVILRRFDEIFKDNYDYEKLKSYINIFEPTE